MKLRPGTDEQGVRVLTLSFMGFFMIGLPNSKGLRLIIRTNVPYEGTRTPTQLLLKQACEQNELSFPSFKHVGHCNVPASFGQSTPIQRFFVASVVAIMGTGVWRYKV